MGKQEPETSVITSVKISCLPRIAIHSLPEFFHAYTLALVIAWEGWESQDARPGRQPHPATLSAVGQQKCTRTTTMRNPVETLSSQVSMAGVAHLHRLYSRCCTPYLPGEGHWAVFGFQRQPVPWVFRGGTAFLEQAIILNPAQQTALYSFPRTCTHILKPSPPRTRPDQPGLSLEADSRREPQISG